MVYWVLVILWSAFGFGETLPNGIVFIAYILQFYFYGMSALF